MDNSSTMQSIGLPENLEEIYWPLLEEGLLTNQEVALSLSISQSEAKKATQTLREKGLALKVGETPTRYLFLPPYSLFLKLLTRIQSEIEDLTDRIGGEVEERIESPLKSIFSLKENITEVSHRFEENLTKFNETTQKTTESLKKHIKEDLKEISGSLSNLKSRYQEFKENLRDQLSENLETSTENVKEKFSEELEELTETVQAEFNTIKEKNQKLRASLETVEEINVEHVQKIVHERVKERENKIRQRIKEIEERKKRVEKDVFNLIEKFDERVSGDLSDLKNKIIKTLEPLRGEEEQTIGSKSEALQRKVEKLEEQIDERLDEVKEEFKENLANLLEGFRDQVNETFEGLETEITEKFESLSQKIDETETKSRKTTGRAEYADVVQKEFDKLESNAETHLLSIKEDLLEELRELIGRTGANISTELENIEGKVIKSKDKAVGEVAKVQTTVTKNIEPLTEELTSNLESISEKLESQVRESKSEIKEGVRTKIERGTKEAISPIAPSIDKTREMIEKIKEQELKGKKIWLMKGLDRIQAYLKDALSRAQRMVLIVTPDPTYLPLEQISDLKRTVSLRIAMGYDQFQYEHRKVKGVLSKLKRVQIRRDEKKLVFGVIVDDEEGFFAPVTEKEEMGELLAMTTNAREWILAFHDILQYSWSLAKRIRD